MHQCQPPEPTPSRLSSRRGKRTPAVGPGRSHEEGAPSARRRSREPTFMLQPSAFPPHGQRKCSYRDSYRGTKVAGRTRTGAIRARYCGPCRYLPVHTPSAPRRRMRTKENKQNGTRPGSEDEPRALREWVGRLRAVGFARRGDGVGWFAGVRGGVLVRGPLRVLRTACSSTERCGTD